jgi:hypothetical protein
METSVVSLSHNTGVLDKEDYFPYCVLEERDSTSRVVISMYVLFLPDISVYEAFSGGAQAYYLIMDFNMKINVTY